MHTSIFLSLAPMTTLLPGTVLATVKKPEFQLRTAVTQGDKAHFNNMYINPFHTGAGESAAVGTRNRTEAQAYLLTDTYVAFLGGSPSTPFTFGLSNSTAYMSSAPASYKLVTINAGHNTPGFCLSGREGFVEYNGDVDFATFAICSVNGTAPYFSAGPQKQLFWRNSTQAAHKHCADVKLQAPPV